MFLHLDCWKENNCRTTWRKGRIRTSSLLVVFLHESNPFSTLLLSWQMKHGAFFHVHQNKASISVPTGEVRRKNKHPNKLPKFNLECQIDGFQKESSIPGCHFQSFSGSMLNLGRVPKTSNIGQYPPIMSNVDSILLSFAKSAHPAESSLCKQDKEINTILL